MKCRIGIFVIPVIFCLVFVIYGDDLEGKKLAAIKGEIKQLQKELEKSREKKETILTKLDELSISGRLKKKELERYKLEITSLNNNIDKRTKNIALLVEDIEKQKKYISRRLIEMYKLGKMNYLRVILSMENPGEMLRSYKYLSKLAEKNSQYLIQFRTNKKQLEEENIILNEQKEKLTKLKKIALLKKKEIDSSEQKFKTMLEAIENDEVQRKNALKELERAATALENLITGFSEKTDISQTFVSISKLKGLLSWPIRGEILLPFGKVKHPKFKTITLHNGIDIKTEAGQTVKSTYNGTVVFCDWFEGYGKTVIIDHNENYFSVYSHLSKFSVAVGDFIAKGQKIAESGETGSLKGAYLYFEIRKGTEALNPLEWLEK